MNAESWVAAARSGQKRAAKAYVEPTLRFIVRWREGNSCRAVRQRALSLEEDARALLTVLRERAKEPGSTISMPQASFSDGQSVEAGTERVIMHGQMTNRFTVIWYYFRKIIDAKSGKQRMAVGKWHSKHLSTREEAFEFHRLTWMANRTKAGFVIRRYIGCRLS